MRNFHALPRFLPHPLLFDFCNFVFIWSMFVFLKILVERKEKLLMQIVRMSLITDCVMEHHSGHEIFDPHKIRTIKGFVTVLSFLYPGLQL